MLKKSTRKWMRLKIFLCFYRQNQTRSCQVERTSQARPRTFCFSWLGILKMSIVRHTKSLKHRPVPSFRAAAGTPHAEKARVAMYRVPRYAQRRSPWALSRVKIRFPRRAGLSPQRRTFEPHRERGFRDEPLFLLEVLWHE